MEHRAYRRVLLLVLLLLAAGCAHHARRDAPEVYFERESGAVEVPVAALRPIRFRPDAVARAELRLRWLAEGVASGKEPPLLVRADGDGFYTVLAGNAVYAAARRRGLGRVLARVLAPGERPPPRPSSAERLAEVRAALARAIATGQLEGTVEGHVATARRIIPAHEAGFVATIEALEALFPRRHVIGRIKTLESSLGKLVRSPGMRSAEDLYDVTGTRVITPALAEVERVVATLRRRYPVLAERDYLRSPRAGYRAYHLHLRWPDGLVKEVQVMTRNQHVFATLAHPAYKPRTPAQRALLEAEGRPVQAYYEALSEHLWKLDRGQPAGAPPPCPPAVRDAFACYVPGAAPG